ncbi:MAG: peptidoglycan recognition family protein [Ruminococcus sp.]|nr:peptidoglycan recognition family protein [Ruminococcus sp.]
MSYNLIKKHTKVNYSKGNSGRKYIVLHYTGNKTDTAAANANYFYDVNRDASAHYFVDDNNVYEVVSPDNTAWSVGVNYGTNNLFGKCTNSNSINIEMCSANGKISDKTFANAVALTKVLMSEYNIPVSRVVRHYDVCSKQCPGWKGWTGSDTSLWKKFKSALTDTYVKVKKYVGLYKKAYTDPVGGSNDKILVIPKGAKVKFLYDDKTGWSCVEYKGKKGFIVNSQIKKSGLSKYPQRIVPKGTTYKRVKSGKIAYTRTLKKKTKFKIICYIESGKYKGYYYCYRNHKYYYIKF